MNADIQTIISMMSFKRPKGSATERQFREHFLSPLGVQEDKFGNLHLTIGTKPKVMWASHTDTVHTSEGIAKIALNGNIISLAEGESANCLGADDASGVWLMMEMIKAKVPGLYVFHYGEEAGGIGARAIIKETPELVKGIKAVISFDRMGTDSIITHQGGERTASDAFGKSLAALLMDGYKLDTGGTYTDSKEYRGIVSECTNVSVGYSRQHSPFETQDVAHLIALRDKLVAIDLSKLVFERKPKIEKRPSYRGGFGGYSGWGGYSNRKTSAEMLEDVLWAYPEDVATVIQEEGFLEQAGLSVEQFKELVLERRQNRRSLRRAVARLAA